MENQSSTPPQPATNQTASPVNQVTPPDSQILPEKPKGRIPKPAIIGAIVFVILAILAGIVFAFKDQIPGLAKPTPTPAPSPAIKKMEQAPELVTYSNDEFGFSIQYPSDFTFYENEDVSVDGVKIATPQTVTLLSPTIEELDTNFKISINYEEGEKLTLAQYSQQKQIPSQGKNINLAGVDGYIFEDTPIGPRPRSMVYLNNNGTDFNITIESTVNYEDIKKYVEQILSTFKFTEPSITPEVSPSISTSSAN